MYNHRSRNRFGGLTLIAAIFWFVSVQAKDAWISVGVGGKPVVKEITTAEPAGLRVQGYNKNGIRLSVGVPGVGLLPRTTKGGNFVVVTWPEASNAGNVGTPSLPVIRRLFVVPRGAAVLVTAKADVVTEIDGSAIGEPLKVMPEQPPIPKIPGAVENAPFAFEPSAYRASIDYLADIAVAKEVGIVRGQRLFILEIHPVAYNPLAQKILLRSQISVAVKFSGGSSLSNLNPLPGLRRIILNPETYIVLKAQTYKNYLVITPTTLESAIAPLLAYKSARGLNVTKHVVSPGESAATIKSYIQSLWGTANAPDYVLLVGDVDLIPTWTGEGADSPATDLQYGCMDGATDWLPDMAIGRLPVNNEGQLADVLDKTLYYDKAKFADPDYLKRAAFLASTDNSNISEGTHNWVIQTHLESNEIAVDKLFTVSNHATTEDVRTSLNSGRFFAIYSGHGSTNSWADGPPFSQSDVRGLTNENMYSLVMSFSCLTGQFTQNESFMETWVVTPRKGAIAAFGSSVTSYWTEDDVLEKRWFDSIYDAQDGVPAEFGPVFNDAKMRYLAQMGDVPNTRRYFEMYNLLGDPSLQYPRACSEAGSIRLDRGRYTYGGNVAITVSDCGLNANDNAAETVTINITSNSDPAGKMVKLTETGPASARFVGTIAVSNAGGDTVLKIAEGDTITALYQDANNGSGAPAVVTATAGVDIVPPRISNVRVTEIKPRAATVAFDTDERARATISYGPTCSALAQSAGAAIANPIAVTIAGLQINSRYFFAVAAEDEAGNTIIDNNNGACYSFSTPEIPDFFTEEFSSSGHMNDLANKTILFRPNGAGDYYRGCVEQITNLPTDPSGGTDLRLSDDSNADVAVADGKQLSLYGVNYANVYVGSNGFITFGSGDSTSTESLEAHFSKPRIAALFDDLNPNTGGTVSYKQLPDRIAITWQDVPEYSYTEPNTFQIEVFFAGDIRISYLGLNVKHGLAGLSNGSGLSPDFQPSDLSTLGNCPRSADGSACSN